MNSLRSLKILFNDKKSIFRKARPFVYAVFSPLAFAQRTHRTFKYFQMAA